jgi:alkylation response protein AidB-like acyl-CoA dehydrogenase
MSSITSRIESPTDDVLAELCGRLKNKTGQWDATGAFPDESLRWCAEAGVFQWFAGPKWGGQQWTESDIIRGYLALSAACLTTTFVITQRTGACQRIERSDNDTVKERLLPGLIRGDLFATVGISHLTTSRRHLARPVLYCEEHGSHLVLDGYSPWVTGADVADVVVVGATLADGREVLVALPTDLPGVEVPDPLQLVGLSASHTGPLKCHGVRVSREWLLAGPVREVMKQGVGARTGGLQTSTLAIGHAACGIEFLEDESIQRMELANAAGALRADWNLLREDLLLAADDRTIESRVASSRNQRPVCTDAELRTRANSIALRASQAALSAAKGAGYVADHPAGRWCREALFFLVWSCPQPVLAANLCEFAGLEG